MIVHEFQLQENLSVLGEAETMPESERQEFEQPFPGIRIFREKRSTATN